jgi:hypothetical protein
MSDSYFAGGTYHGVGAGGAGLEGSSIRPATTGVSNPAAGVVPGEVKRARNNSGSNIRIPYLRVVPTREQCEDASLGTLRVKDHHDYRLHTGPKQFKKTQHENEDLAVGGIVFVRGHGKKVVDNPADMSTTGLDPEAYEDADMQTMLRLNTGTGVDKLSRLCTLEYARRFYEVRMFNVEIPLPAGVVAGVGPFLTCPTRSDDVSPLGTALHRGGIGGFKHLTDAMQNEGLLTWTPDGIVVGKDHVGDEMDHVYDSRLNQLFNVAVQGPATTTDYCNDPDMLCLPNDNVFVLVVCDVAVDRPDALTTVKTVAQARTALADIEAQLRTSAVDARTTPATVIESVKDTYSQCQSVAQKLIDEGEPAVITGDKKLFNFRLVLSTSSQMVRWSGAAAGASPAQECFPAGKERLGLRAGIVDGSYYAQYVVGGWSIGHVLDSAATRPYTGMYNPLQNPLTSSLNVFVNCKWWTGNALHEAYGSSRNAVTNQYECCALTALDRLNNAMSRLRVFNVAPQGGVHKDVAGRLWTALSSSSWSNGRSAGEKKKDMEAVGLANFVTMMTQNYEDLRMKHVLGVCIRVTSSYTSSDPDRTKRMTEARSGMIACQRRVKDVATPGDYANNKMTIAWIKESATWARAAYVLLYRDAAVEALNKTEHAFLYNDNEWWAEIVVAPAAVEDSDSTSADELARAKTAKDSLGEVMQLVTTQ